METPAHLRNWDIACRVVDNHGDLGVCWRLACGLAATGRQVRLRCDAPADLAWMAPSGADHVTVVDWHHAGPPGDVVVDGFGCTTPAVVLAAMAARRPAPPVWINLEYLSAEPYTLRCHGLPSPQTVGPAAGLVQWFYYPGFAPGSGGLLHEDGLAQQRQQHDPLAWLSGLGIAALPVERRVSLYCYDNAALPALLDCLGLQPTLLLVTPGHAARQVSALLGPSLQRGRLRAVLLPYLPQTGFDRLLWSCHLNLVRGEDTLVRAIWAGQPFLWQAYPQDDGAHVAKVEALADTLVADTGGGDTDAITWRAALCAWNGIGPPVPDQAESGAGLAMRTDVGPGDDAARSALAAFLCADTAPRLRRWRAQLLTQPSLVDRLIAFAQTHR